MWQKGNTLGSDSYTGNKIAGWEGRKVGRTKGDDVPNEIGHQRGPTLPFGIRIEPNKLMYRARQSRECGDIKPKLCKSKNVSLSLRICKMFNP